MASIEWINFKVKAVLVGYKLSDDERDLHVVIKDLKTKETMIVEFPSPECQGVCAYDFDSDMRRGREQFASSEPVLDRGKVTTTFKTPSKRLLVEVIGVGFWSCISLLRSSETNKKVKLKPHEGVDDT
ncbi:MAG: hypothetical protein ABJB34_01060 [Acidobacteriota bacterium]